MNHLGLDNRGVRFSGGGNAGSDLGTLECHRLDTERGLIPRRWVSGGDGGGFRWARAVLTGIGQDAIPNRRAHVLSSRFNRSSSVTLRTVPVPSRPAS